MGSWGGAAGAGEQSPSLCTAGLVLPTLCSLSSSRSQDQPLNKGRLVPVGVAGGICGTRDGRCPSRRVFALGMSCHGQELG